MSFSNEWENIYASGNQLNNWPWSDLVSLVFQNRGLLPNNPANVLELGPGSGPNIHFLKTIGMNYFGIEGSQTATNVMWEKFPELKEQIICGDFTKSLHFHKPFDLIVDRASLIHNDLESINKTIQLILEKLVPGGIFIGIDWFASDHPLAKEGSDGPDQNTRANIQKGTFSGVGNVHFFPEQELRDSLQKFEITHLEKKNIQNLSSSESSFGHSGFTFVARKKL